MNQAATDEVINQIHSVYSRWGRGTSVSKMRHDWDAFFSLRSAPWPIQSVQAGGVAAEWIAEQDSPSDRAILYLHGGGFRIGSIASHRDLMQRLAQAAQTRVLGIDYRLSPEHLFPAPVEDALSAYRWLLDQGLAPARIAIVGDSAGGGLAVSTMLAARSRGLKLPGAAVLMSGWMDLEASGQSYTALAEIDPINQRAMIVAMARGYLGPAGNPKDPLASPLLGDLSGLPPILLQCGSSEIVLDDTFAFAERARQAGVTVEVQIFEDMIHVFQMFAAELSEARRAITSAGSFVLTHVGN